MKHFSFILFMAFIFLLNQLGVTETKKVAAIMIGVLLLMGFAYWEGLNER